MRSISSFIDVSHCHWTDPSDHTAGDVSASEGVTRSARIRIFVDGLCGITT